MAVVVGRRANGDPAARLARATMVVEFRLSAPGAREVALVGDFNSWKPAHQLHQSAPGVWTVSVPLEPGVYDYGFVVDGSAVRLDPLAPRVADGFGGESSRVTVLSPEVRS
jgi:1,4-alpha-glucan branching enzyme